jgi:hydrogenase maturation factor
MERAQNYIFEPGISVVREAMTASEALRGARSSVHAMHDPTEGGLATALYELAEASGLGVAVEEREITVLPETEAICAAASLEPLGLLASGALLIAVAEQDCQTALSALSAAGIEARQIGGMVRREAGAIMEGRAGTAPVPQFARDEVARFLAG